MAAQDSQILENAEAESQQGHIVKVDAQAVTHKDQESRQQGIGEEAADKDRIVKVTAQGCPQAAKDGIQRGQESHRKELGIGQSYHYGKT